ncbi:MAG: hypothetical protein SFV54_26975 [Bryobacteraceae bacterium]|nr:hypothetical protein [Bryobacteraceae bacterium]
MTGWRFAERYEVHELLRLGKDTAEYRAVDRDAPDRVLALKVLPSGDVIPYERLRDLRHPNLRAILDAGEVQVDGSTLRYIVTEAGDAWADELPAPLDNGQARILARDVLSGLAHLEDQGLRYGSLRPDSVVRVRGAWKLSDPERAQPGAGAEDLPGFEALIRRLMGELPPPFVTAVRACSDRSCGAADIAQALGVKLIGPSGAVRETAPPPATGTRRGARVRSYSVPVFEERAAARDEVPPNVPFEFGGMEPDPPVGGSGRWRLAAAVVAGVLVGGVLLATLREWTWSRSLERPAEASKTAPQRPAEQRLPEPEAARPPAAGEAGEPKTEEQPPAEAPFNSVQRREAIFRLLESWTAATRNQDVSALSKHYALRVSKYYRQSGVSRDFVLRDKETLFKDIDRVRRFGVSRYRVESLTPERAVVSFLKEWDFEGQRPFAGAERQRLTLLWLDGRWQIVGEEDGQVYWVRRGRR